MNMCTSQHDKQLTLDHFIQRLTNAGATTERLDLARTTASQCSSRSQRPKTHNDDKQSTNTWWLVMPWHNMWRGSPIAAKLKQLATRKDCVDMILMHGSATIDNAAGDADGGVRGKDGGSITSTCLVSC